jgi:hypothetical protein
MSTLPLYLTEDDVARLVTMQDAIAATEQAFAAWRDPGTTNLPRARAPVPPGFLNLMGATYGRAACSATSPISATPRTSRFTRSPRRGSRR